MEGNIEAHIIARVATFLGASEDLSAVELYNLLFDYRTTVHPDKYQDDSARESAEERFKAANSLLQELNAYIQQQSLVARPKDLIPLQTHYELMRVREQLISKERETEDLKDELESAQWDVQKLKSELDHLREMKVSAITNTIDREHGYKAGPTVSATAGLALGTTLVTLSQYTDVLQKLQNMLPFHGIWMTLITAGDTVNLGGWASLRFVAYAADSSTRIPSLNSRPA